MIGTFLVFKTLLCLAIFSSPQWDKSSELIGVSNTFARRIAQRFLTWDSVYFLSAAVDRPAFEHELAFSQVWSLILRRLTEALPTIELSYTSLALTAVLVSTAAHYAACLVLSRSGPLFSRSALAGDEKLAALLYIICPAGVFLSCGYTESLFALLTFTGLALNYQKRVALSGLLLALSCLLRSNGILWSLLYALQACECLSTAFKNRKSLSPAILKTVIPNAFAAMLVLLAFLLPQLRLYFSLCPGRPWCSSSLPLAYGYIQNTYWNVGFLRYWTTNNIANFLFAVPTLFLLIRSTPSAPKSLAVVQIAVVIGALFFWHVQIVTRLASCLPTPYLFMARKLRAGSLEGKLWASYALVWTLAQGVLFGSYLPPA